MAQGFKGDRWAVREPCLEGPSVQSGLAQGSYLRRRVVRSIEWLKNTCISLCRYRIDLYTVSLKIRIIGL